MNVEYNQIFGSVVATVCTVCGASVLDRDTHTEWHDRQNRLDVLMVTGLTMQGTYTVNQIREALGMEALNEGQGTD